MAKINLLMFANEIRKGTNMSQKEALAEARKRIAEQTATATAEQTATEIVAKPAGKKRGNYVRDDAWKAKHAADMKAYWANRKANKVAA